MKDHEMFQRFKKTAVSTFSAYFDTRLYTAQFYLLDHPADDLSWSGSNNFQDGSLCKAFKKQIKNVNQRTSRRLQTCVKETATRLISILCSTRVSNLRGRMRSRTKEVESGFRSHKMEIILCGKRNDASCKRFRITSIAMDTMYIFCHFWKNLKASRARNAKRLCTTCFKKRLHAKRIT